MPLGERQIIQTGVNGLQELTYQHVIENGIEISSSIISRTVIREPQNEIVMEGVQSPNVPVTLNGKIALPDSRQCLADERFDHQTATPGHDRRSGLANL